MSLPADQLTRLIALSDGPHAGVVRRVCAQTVSLEPLPGASANESDVALTEPALTEFAEQFSADVSMITPEQRSRLFKHLGDETFATVIGMFVADFAPRVRAGLEALGVGSEYLGWVNGEPPASVDGDLGDELFNRFLPGVARERALDPVTTELVRLRGAVAHNCRLCKSLREERALDAGGSESLYDEIPNFEKSVLLDDRAKAALRYADALIWSPAHLAVDDAAEVRSWFSPDEAVELTFDIMRNASNKIAVSLGADAAQVESGTQRYLIDADGQTLYR